MYNQAHHIICKQTYPLRQEEGMLLCHYYFSGPSRRRINIAGRSGDFVFFPKAKLFNEKILLCACVLPIKIRTFRNAYEPAGGERASVEGPAAQGENVEADVRGVPGDANDPFQTSNAASFEPLIADGGTAEALPSSSHEPMVMPESVS